MNTPEFIHSNERWLLQRSPLGRLYTYSNNALSRAENIAEASPLELLSKPVAYSFDAPQGGKFLSYVGRFDVSSYLER